MNRQLTDHFSLDEMTHTDRGEFLLKNRQVSEDQINKLSEVAKLCEQVRSILNCSMHVHSAYRCPELNAAVGSSGRSQHMLCEATDFDRGGQDYTAEALDQDFKTIIAAARSGQIKFGQLICESANRYTKNGTAVSRWLHISLGAPWRPAERCGQVLIMKNGVYETVCTI